MKEKFWGLVAGSDNDLSLAKVMLWPTFFAVVGAAFYPDADATHLLMVFDSLLLYVLGGKVSFRKWRAKD